MVSKESLSAFDEIGYHPFLGRISFIHQCCPFIRATFNVNRGSNLLFTGDLVPFDGVDQLFEIRVSARVSVVSRMEETRSGLTVDSIYPSQARH